jgi:hypothetical protein
MVDLTGARRVAESVLNDGLRLGKLVASATL